MKSKPDITIRDGELLIPVCPAHARLPSAMMQSSHEKGIIIQPGGKQRSWNWFGFTVLEGWRCVRGEFLELSPFHSLFRRTQEEQITILKNLARSLEKWKTDRPLELYGVFIIPDDSFFILPEAITELIRSFLDERSLFSEQKQWIATGLTGTRALTYELSALAYAAYTGVSPIADEYVREDGYTPVPIELLTSSIAPEASAWFSAQLSEPDTDYHRWAFRFVQILSIEQVHGPNRERELMEFRTRQKKRAERKRNRRIHRTRNIILSAVVTIVLATGASLFFQSLKPHPTDGLSQRELITYYYEAHDQVNLAHIGEALAPRAKSPFSTMLSYLHVTGSVRSAYEHTSGIISAGSWVEEGKPQLPDDATLIGVSDLDIRRVDEDTYEASYIFWAPLSPEEQAQSDGMPAAAFRTVDELNLEKRGDRYVITQVRQKIYERL
jgi:hypothetical protein